MSPAEILPMAVDGWPAGDHVRSLHGPASSGPQIHLVATPGYALRDQHPLIAQVMNIGTQADAEALRADARRSDAWLDHVESIGQTNTVAASIRLHYRACPVIRLLSAPVPLQFK